MRNREYIICLQNVLQLLEEGVHVVDAQGNSVIYNRSMARLEKMESREVLKKPFSEIFKHLNAENSTLIKALQTGRSTWNKEQTYLNKDGKQITTLNTTVPVMDKGEIIAAVEIARNITDLQQMTDTIIELRKEIDAPKSSREKAIKRYEFSDVFGESPEFLETLELAKRAAKTNASCIIYGETGTGKELIAQSIHYASDRAKMPFLAQNCAAVPENLLEGLLFGTSKGGFTGAIDRPGLFEQADGGTLLLDEVHTMPPNLQVKLLRVLQENYIRRVGGTKDIPVDVRIIATVNEPPEQLIAEGRMRRDLYYRIAVLRIAIPPLRARRGDIVLLAEKFMDKYNEKYDRQAWMLSEGAREKLLSYDYPGNVRELENIIMSAMSLLDRGDHVIEADDLVISRRKSLPAVELYGLGEGGLSEYIARVEQEMIESALLASGGNISRAADHLKIKRQTLQHKIKKYKGESEEEF